MEILILCSSCIEQSTTHRGRKNYMGLTKSIGLVPCPASRRTASSGRDSAGASPSRFHRQPCAAMQGVFGKRENGEWTTINHAVFHLVPNKDYSFTKTTASPQNTIQYNLER